MPINPDRCDYEQVEREYGALPPNATDRQTAEHYRLALVAKLIRLFSQGKLDELNR